MSIQDDVKDGLNSLTGGDTRLTCIPLSWDAIPTGDDPTSNVRTHQLAIEGEWDGHWMGPFTLSDSHFDQMAAHQRSKGVDTVVDYEHSTLNPLLGKNPAAGWVEHLETRETPQGKALFGRVRWTEAAANHIRNREYRYLSPTIVFRTPDRVTGQDLGASLHSVALTNTPFLEELPEVRLNSLARALRTETTKQESNIMDEKERQALALAVGAPLDTPTDRLVEEAVKFRRSHITLNDVAKTLGAEPEHVVGAVEALKAAADALRGAAEEAKSLKADALVNAARTEGKVTGDNEAFARKLALDHPELFAQWRETAAAIVPNEQKTPRKESNGEISKDPIALLVATLTEAELAVCKNRGWAPETYVKHNLDELAAERL
jgi:phage I-like protein